MTKHLRLIMLSLLAMICMGGYSAVGDTYKLVTSVDELHDGDLIVIVNSDNQKAMGMQNTNNRASVDIFFADDTRESFNLVAKVAVLTLKKADDKWKFHSTHGYLYAPGTSNKNYLKSSDDGTLKGSFATITFKDKNAVIKFDCNNSNLIRYNSNKDQQIFSCYASGQQDVQIYKKQGPGLTSTSTTFGTNYDGKTFDFVNGVLEGWKAPTATHTPADLTGNTKYTSDNVSVADVDQEGQLTFSGYGTATITATFTPDETKTYAVSSASYTVINKDPNAVDVVFVAGVDKGTTTDTSADGMSKGEVTIASSSAALGNSTDYRFYAGSTTTFSVKTGKIVKIEFVGDKDKIRDNYLNNLSLLEGEPGTLVTDKYEATWTGEASSIKFKPSKQARATKITITVVGAIFLDENSDNIVEAAENVNVTLKRKLIADDNWNTLCVPFNLTPEQTTKAFGADVELRTLTHAEGTTLTFGKATEIEAGKPYLIRVKEVPTDYVYKFTGVKVIASGDNWTIQNVGNVNFIGLYAPRDVTELEMLIDGGVALFLGDNNKFFRAQSGTKMGGFRAFFLVSKDTNPTNVKAVIDGVANGIEDLVIDGVKANGRVYNLNGQYVGKSLNGLQPGLYIQNGKKIVIK